MQASLVAGDHIGKKQSCLVGGEKICVAVNCGGQFLRNKTHTHTGVHPKRTCTSVNMTHTMLSIVSAYLAHRQVSRLYSQSITNTAKKMDAVGIDTSTISGERVNRWLSSLTCSDETKSNLRRMALCLWRWAFESGMTERPVRGVASIRVRRKPTAAWTRSQCLSLVKLAESQTGNLRSGVGRAAFWGAWCRCAYETGLRFSDIHSLTLDSVFDGTISISMSKTGEPITRPITHDLELRLVSLAKGDKAGRIFSRHLNRKNLFTCARKLLDEAGVRGSLKYWRRSGATHCEVENPGSARRYLGHRTPGLAERCYIDHRQLRSSQPSPPPLDCPK